MIAFPDFLYIHGYSVTTYHDHGKVTYKAIKDSSMGRKTTWTSRNYQSEQEAIDAATAHYVLHRIAQA